MNCVTGWGKFMWLGHIEQGRARERICDFEKLCFDGDCQEFVSSRLFYFHVCPAISPSLLGLLRSA